VYATASWAASPSFDGLEERLSSSIMTGAGMTMVHRRTLMMDATTDKEDKITLAIQASCIQARCSEMASRHVSGNGMGASTVWIPERVHADMGQEEIAGISDVPISGIRWRPGTHTYARSNPLQ
jgi:hypothetical protein